MGRADRMGQVDRKGSEGKAGPSRDGPALLLPKGAAWTIATVCAALLSVYLLANVRVL